MLRTRRAFFALVAVLAIASVACSTTPVHSSRSGLASSDADTGATINATVKDFSIAIDPAESLVARSRSRSPTRGRARTSSSWSRPTTRPGTCRLRTARSARTSLNVIGEAEDIAPSTTADLTLTLDRGQLRDHLQHAGPLRAGDVRRAEGHLAGSTDHRDVRPARLPRRPTPSRGPKRFSTLKLRRRQGRWNAHPEPAGSTDPAGSLWTSTPSTLAPIRTRSRAASSHPRMRRSRTRARAAGRPRSAISRADRPPAGRAVHRRRRRRRPDGRREPGDLRSLLGVTREEWLREGSDWSDYVHPEDRQRVVAESDACVATGEPFHSSTARSTPTGASCGSARTPC